MIYKRYWEALKDVKDPEIPTISVIDMGMVRELTLLNNILYVEMLPTFVGCPALEMIRESVRSRLLNEDEIDEVKVEFVFDPPWTSDRITKEGRDRLKEFGIAPPSESEDKLLPLCPYCGSEDGKVESLFGPTACRAIFYCKNCHQPFEGMKVLL